MTITRDYNTLTPVFSTGGHSCTMVPVLAAGPYAEKFCGIYEMATGTGKTRTAIGSMRELEKTEENFISMIVVPTDPLAVQWKGELEKWGYTTKLTLKSSNWKQEISDYLLLAESNNVKNLCIITTYVTFANILFQEKLNQSKLKKLLIADEVHHAGAANAQNGLLFNYNFRLGLTATINRYFEPSGSSLRSAHREDRLYNLSRKAFMKLFQPFKKIQDYEKID